MSESITLSPKHGVNPSVTHCECCGKEIGLALFGRLKGDAEAPRDVAMGLCDDCKKVIDAQGLMIIEVRDGESGKNPYRTGRLVGIPKRECSRTLIPLYAIWSSLCLVLCLVNIVSKTKRK